MTRTGSALLGVCLTAGAVLGPALPALAAGSGSATVRPAAEAWYRTTPACALPTGCAALPAPSPYSADTLHVGVHAGTEEARTYLRLDLSALPAGVIPTGGTLRLPVTTSSGDGTRAPDTAQLRACAVTGEVTDVDGSFGTPPEVDCEAAETAATFVPSAGDRPGAFIVDLAALAAAWDGAATPGAVGLLPAAKTAPPQSWHVAFSDRSRKGVAVAPIGATLAFSSTTLASGSVAPSTFPPPAAFAPSPGFPSSTGAGDLDAFATPFLPAQAPLLPAPAPAAPAVPAPATVVPVQQVVPVAQSFLQGGFRYPAVFLLPLLLALAVAWLGRAMTRDLADRP